MLLFFSMKHIIEIDSSRGNHQARYPAVLYVKSFISFTDFIVLITIVDVSKLYQNSLSIAWEQSSMTKAEIKR